ncbi:hypothetical protein Tco_0441947 [Tanacetum coccineum]
MSNFKSGQQNVLLTFTHLGSAVLKEDCPQVDLLPNQSSKGTIVHAVDHGNIQIIVSQLPVYNEQTYMATLQTADIKGEEIILVSVWPGKTNGGFSFSFDSDKFVFLKQLIWVLNDVILGIEVSNRENSNGLVLSQAHYVDKILNTHNAGDSGQARTPIDTSLHLSKNRGLGVAQLEYSRIIGMLMYLMTGTRPDLAYAVSRLSRYTSNPSYAHWKAITRVLHYLRYSRDYGLHYDRHPAVIEGYSDANWISDIKDSRSTSGYVFTLGGAAISWKSSKQTVIAKSTMESEFIALDKCGEEAEWLRQFVEDIPRWPKPVTAISIHCDSKSAMGRAKSTMYNGKSRHIRRRHNSIRQLLSTGVISIDYVASKDNIADPFTKGLSRELVSKSSKGMGLKPLKE